MRLFFQDPRWLVAVVTACCVSLASAAPYEAGSKVESFTAKDQHEQVFTLKPESVNYLLVSHDMDTGKKANAVLNGLGKDYLTGKKAVYIANIFGMPGIGRAFALPKMKKYVHQIILGDDEALIGKFPEQKGKVTVLSLQDGKVKSIAYWSPSDQAIDGFVK